MRVNITVKLFAGYLVIIFLNLFLFVIVNKTSDIKTITNILKIQNEIKNNLVRYNNLHNTQELIAFSFERAGLKESVDNFRDVNTKMLEVMDSVRSQMNTVHHLDSMVNPKNDTTLSDFRNQLKKIVHLHTLYNSIFDTLVVSRRPGTISQTEEFKKIRENMSQKHEILNSNLSSSLERVEEINKSYIRDVENRVSNVRFVTIVIFSGMTLFSMIFGFFFSKAITNSLRRLKETAQTVAKGNFDVNPSGFPNDETGDLATAFFNMSVDLKNAQDELVRSKRMAAIGEVVASINHEINNPLMIISGNAQFLEMTMQHYPKEVQERIEAILAETERISKVTRKLQNIKNPVSEDYTSGGEQMINLDRSS
ncbi:sensor histidine kinase [Chitinispirillum alkaliphilum]|nr:sensor histidine kinase [Chitinispirillum alkaliphilum]